MVSISNVHDLLVDDESQDVCEDLPESACHAAPRNFSLLLGSYVLTKLGDALASPKTVLAWVMTSVGAPLHLIGFLVPIRESGAMIPQLFTAGWVRRRAVRKWVWVIGALLQAVAIVAIGLVALSPLSGAPAGLSILGLLILFSLARSLSSIASKDVLGKTIPKGRRGQLTGWSASVSGLITLTIGALLALPVLEERTREFYGLFVIGAGLLWLLASILYTNVSEKAGETGGAGDSGWNVLSRLRVLLSDAPFRRFVITRSLMLCSALSAPFYVVLARDSVGDKPWLLGLFVAATGLASLVAAPFWGRFADRSSRRVMQASALSAGLLGVLVGTAAILSPALSASTIFIPSCYLLLMMTHSGARTGRKTYVVDLAEGNQRTDYVSVSNTVIGVLLLIGGLAGTLASATSVPTAIIALGCLGLLGGLMAQTLPEVE